MKCQGIFHGLEDREKRGCITTACSRTAAPRPPLMLGVMPLLLQLELAAWVVATMLDHVDFAVQDLALSQAFYVTALAPLGIRPLIEIDREDGRQGTGFGLGELTQFHIGGGRPVAGRLHVAFAAQTRAAVDAFHRAALDAGGKDNGKPGLRLRYDEHYYAAYVLDPDGHVVEAVCRVPA